MALRRALEISQGGCSVDPDSTESGRTGLAEEPDAVQ